MPSFRGSSPPRDQTHVSYASCHGRRVLHHLGSPIYSFKGFTGSSDGKEPKCNVETWVQSLGWEDPLEKGTATHSSVQACRIHGLYSVQSLSRVRLCDPVDCSTPGFPGHHQLPEFIHTHVHSVGDAIRTSHSSVGPFFFHFQSFPASGSFQMSQFFPSGSQSIRISASASVLPKNIQDLFPLGLTG